MDVSTLNLKDQDRVRSLRLRIANYIEASQELNKLLRELAAKYFEDPSLTLDKVEVDTTGRYITRS